MACLAAVVAFLPGGVVNSMHPTPAMDEISDRRTVFPADAASYALTARGLVIGRGLGAESMAFWQLSRRIDCRGSFVQAFNLGGGIIEPKGGRTDNDIRHKINKVNVELKQQILEDNKKLQVEKQSLKEELENTQRKLIDLSDKAAAAPNTERNSEFEAAIVKEVHRLEEQSSKIAVTEQTIMAPPPAIGLGKQGWVYLGEYTEGVWKTRYFDFGPAVKPAALIDRELRVAVHSVNVRTKKFSGDIFKALLKGQVVQIDKVEKYPFTNYMWALVRY